MENMRIHAREERPTRAGGSSGLLSQNATIIANAEARKTPSVIATTRMMAAERKFDARDVALSLCLRRGGAGQVLGKKLLVDAFKIGHGPHICPVCVLEVSVEAQSLL